VKTLGRERRVRAIVGELQELAARSPGMKPRLRRYLKEQESIMAGKMTTFRLEEGLLRALDLAAEKLGKEAGSFGPKWTRVDALRYFVRKGLADLGIPEEPGLPAGDGAEEPGRPRRKKGA
jgi:hypothetical protein